jgi:hypothetical protein
VINVRKSMTPELAQLLLNTLRTRDLSYKSTPHDKALRKLEDRLQFSRIPYQIIRHNVEYFNRRGRIEGECDLWAQYVSKTGKVYNLFFELKTGSAGGSERQLARDRRCLAMGYKCYTFKVKGTEYITRVKV